MHQQGRCLPAWSSDFLDGVGVKKHAVWLDNEGGNAISDVKFQRVHLGSGQQVHPLSSRLALLQIVASIHRPLLPVGFADITVWSLCQMPANVTHYLARVSRIGSGEFGLGFTKQRHYFPA